MTGERFTVVDSDGTRVLMPDGAAWLRTTLPSIGDLVTVNDEEYSVYWIVFPTSDASAGSPGVTQPLVYLRRAC